MCVCMCVCVCVWGVYVGGVCMWVGCVCSCVGVQVCVCVFEVHDFENRYLPHTRVSMKKEPILCIVHTFAIHQ